MDELLLKSDGSVWWHAKETVAERRAPQGVSLIGTQRFPRRGTEGGEYAHFTRERRVVRRQARRSAGARSAEATRRRDKAARGAARGQAAARRSEAEESKAGGL